MANGYFERGEMYWFKFGDSTGSEFTAGRPAVIISCDQGNRTSSVVNVALVTKQTKYFPLDIKTCVDGTWRWVVCNQIMTMDKSRAGNYIGKLSPAEMKAVDDALEEVFDLGYVDTAKEEEIEKLKAQIVELTGEVAREQARVIEAQAKHEDELLSYKVENAMWQKCYERSLDQLVKMKLNTDIRIRVEQKPVETPKKPESVEEDMQEENPPAESPMEDERLDINTATTTALKKAGFTIALAKAVVKARPFASVEDLKKVPGMAKTKYQILAPKLCCVPLAKVVEPEQPETQNTPETQDTTDKLNINALSAKDIQDKLGITNSTSYCIVAYRRKNGPFTKLEDMLAAKQVFAGTIEKIRDKVFCGPGIEEKPVVRNGASHEKPAPDLTKYTGNKVNINLATAQEIHEKTGLSKTVCFSIVGCRNRDGRYRSVEDLENVPRFTDYHMKYYAPMFEV